MAPPAPAPASDLLLVKLKGIQGKLLVCAKTLQQQVESSSTHNNTKNQQLFETTVNECHDLLDEILTVRPMTFDLLQQSRAGKPVGKLTKLIILKDYDDDDDATKNNTATATSTSTSTNPHPHPNNHQLLLLGLVQRAHAVILYWNAQMGCRGGPLQLLTTFRRRQAALTRERQAKPDMVAFKELRRQHAIIKVHGAIPPDVPIGFILHGRGEAAILGIHTSILSGIDAEKGQSCFCVCMSGKYDDKEERNEDGILQYTGAGGLDKRGVQVSDQQETKENASLIQSCATGDPIRVLRRIGKKGSLEYRYEGLYRCIDYSYEASGAGPRVYRFTLNPIDRQSTHFIFKFLKRR